MQIALLGATGRLGAEIKRVLDAENQDCVTLTRSNISSASTLQQSLTQPCVIVDTSLPGGTESLCQSLLELPHNVRQKIHGIVIGTTGHSASQLGQIEKVSAHLPICLVSNFSSGVYLFEQMLKAKTESGRSVAELARALGFDLGLVETHHSEKKDAPSGTAKTLAQAAQIPADRVTSLRVGKVVGEHQILFSADSEQLVVSHSAQSRRLFALGAVRLARVMGAKKLGPGILSRAELQ